MKAAEIMGNMSLLGNTHDMKEEVEVKETKSFINRLIISHDSKWKKVFDFIILFWVGYSWFSTVYYAAFGDPATIGLIVFDYMIEVLFLMSLVLSFFHSFRDPDTNKPVTDIKVIALKYIKGWFFTDFFSLFPFYFFISNGELIQLLRILRMPKLMSLIDVKRTRKIVNSFFENASREEKVLINHLVINAYRIVRLIVIAAVITYFFGCFWYIISNKINSSDDQKTFINKYGLKDEDNFRKLIIWWYYVLTSLSTVGYGDYVPVSNVERIVSIFIIIWGVTFFSYIMGNCIEIISNYDKKKGIQEKSHDLNNWLTLLTRFTNHKPLPAHLVNKIESHFAFFWSNNRLANISKDDPFMATLPRSIKRAIMINYLFKDIFFRFRQFFNTFENRDSKFLYEIAFGFMPRKFEEGEIIYDEDDEVPEIYFIIEGEVGIGYRLPNKAKEIKIAKLFKSRSFICDYYVWNHKKSEFVFQAMKDTKSYALTRRFMDDLFKRYPEVAVKIQKDAFKRYKIIIKDPISKIKNHDLEELKDGSPEAPEINKMESDSMPKFNVANEQDLRIENSADLHVVLKNKIDSIQEEMSKFAKNFNDYVKSCDGELNSIVTGLKNKQ